MNSNIVFHEFGPFYDLNSEILILGSFPSVKSREQQFYYGHPQNRFFKVIANIYDEKIPGTLFQKKELLRDNHIALYDVIESCEIVGSMDSSIKNPKIANIEPILRETKVQGRIFTNGAKAYNLYMKYLYEKTGYEAVKLPSTSPANAAFSTERLTEIWKKAIKEPNFD